ncbi:nucleotide exchange factor GrpE [Thermopolyspora sp. NPDC052614]|uniref:nucleotide exchange factor GrpE n=1 Tax=Thermopolyspora sp. NPDC052614 TaxID=3155682 RepID=UPI00343A15E9
MTSSPLEPPPDDAEDDDAIPEKEKVPLSALDVLARRLAEMEETMRREHERAAHREKVIDRLHAENQELRHGLLEEALTPVRAGLYRLYDNARRQAARWRQEPPSAEHAASLLEALADEVAEVLGRAGAERVSVNPGDIYDPVIHRPVRTADVAPEADGTVVEVLADGFAGVTRGAGGAVRERVARKADVVVGRVRRKPEAANQAAVGTTGTVGAVGALGTSAGLAGKPEVPTRATAAPASDDGPAVGAEQAAETTPTDSTIADHGTATTAGTDTGNDATTAESRTGTTSGTDTGTTSPSTTGTETDGTTTTGAGTVSELGTVTQSRSGSRSEGEFGSGSESESGTGTAAGTGTGTTTSGTGTAATGAGAASVLGAGGREEGDG